VGTVAKHPQDRDPGPVSEQGGDRLRGGDIGCPKVHPGLGENRKLSAHWDDL
jgi:hypothetical protein